MTKIKVSRVGSVKKEELMGPDIVHISVTLMRNFSNTNIFVISVRELKKMAALSLIMIFENLLFSFYYFLILQKACELTHLTLFLKKKKKKLERK